MDLGAEDTLSEEGLAPLRFKMRKKLMEALLVGVTEGDRVGESCAFYLICSVANDFSPSPATPVACLGDHGCRACCKSRGTSAIECLQREVYVVS